MSGWAVSKPIAHRGLHDAARGVIENTIEAAQAAIQGGFAIECDIQRARDGEAMVFHDETLGRLTDAAGRLDAGDGADLSRLTLRGTQARIPALPAFLAAIAGRTPLVCEIKSEFNGDMRLADRACEIASAYGGDIAFKSFDPDVIAHLRARAPRDGLGRPCPLGMVAMAAYSAEDFPGMSEAQRVDCAAFLHIDRTAPDFLSFHVDDLPHPTATLLRALRKLPVMAWTVRRAAQRDLTAKYADQIVFEGGGRP